MRLTLNSLLMLRQLLYLNESDLELAVDVGVLDHLLAELEGRQDRVSGALADVRRVRQRFVHVDARNRLTQCLAFLLMCAFLFTET